MNDPSNSPSPFNEIGMVAKITLAIITQAKLNIEQDEPKEIISKNRQTITIA